MTGASLASQKEKHGWMSVPWTLCVNNWQYPEVSGALQGHTRSWEPGRHRALSPSLLAMAHPSLPQPVLLAPAQPLHGPRPCPQDPTAFI